MYYVELLKIKAETNLETDKIKRSYELERDSTDHKVESRTARHLDHGIQRERYGS